MVYKEVYGVLHSRNLNLPDVQICLSPSAAFQDSAASQGDQILVWSSLQRLMLTSAGLFEDYLTVCGKLRCMGYADPDPLHQSHP